MSNDDNGLKPAAGGYCAPLFGHSIMVEWIEPKVGFGQFVFYSNAKGELFCDNELMSKEFIKRKLCQMVDDCVLTLPPGE